MNNEIQLYRVKTTLPSGHVIVSDPVNINAARGICLEMERKAFRGYFGEDCDVECEIKPVKRP